MVEVIDLSSLFMILICFRAPLRYQDQTGRDVGNFGRLKVLKSTSILQPRHIA